MEEKECKVCHKVKPISEFYETGLGGHYSKCKECYKEQAARYRWSHIEKVRAYDRKRGASPERRKACVEVTKKLRKLKGYDKVHQKLERAVRKGRITKPSVCECCGKRKATEAHHEDYTKVFDVIWLCPACHRNYHQGKTEAAEKIREKVRSAYQKLANASHCNEINFKLTKNG